MCCAVAHSKIQQHFLWKTNLDINDGVNGLFVHLQLSGKLIVFAIYQHLDETICVFFSFEMKIKVGKHLPCLLRSKSLTKNKLKVVEIRGCVFCFCIESLSECQQRDEGTNYLPAD